MFETNDYREVLKSKLEERCRANSRYSLNAFARDIKLPATRLCQIMQRKQGISAKKAQTIAKSLNFSDKEVEMFCSMVLASDARSKSEREIASLKLQLMFKKHENEQLIAEKFSVISDWYHFAILELTDTKEFKNNYQWIASKLGLNESLVKIAIERLIRLGLLKEVDNTLIQTYKNLITDDGVPSEAIRKFNKQILDKAKIAIDFQNVNERKIDTLTTAINQEDLEEFYKKINNFYDELDAWATQRKKNKKQDHVYCFSTQFFKLNK
ncbi:MAG: hypothetical protein A2381_11670 [Bdellovibrionales bacterium RIFOXYB1_FULL_37_110]|nr:MAG: hypothetical protein A2417_11975 [Bdellovibrionales bacterium RIFOXYC1_FULL_37_79]OFZ57347.1 MAG: hypothetical protein A2381_11670 [Bdellovibrionales bacterium RIFOXYB1_FULL_37_110]OFZ62243.1 MAG: hypothetical protein A2577_14220 [Bdellovibrionales bacterium RIFOXYD1_FULL_36_51]